MASSTTDGTRYVFDTLEIRHFSRCAGHYFSWLSVEILYFNQDIANVIYHVVLQIFSVTGYMILITSLEFLLEWERLMLFGHFGYVEITTFLMIRIFLL